MRKRDIKLSTEDLDRLQRNIAIDVNWLYGSTGRREVSKNLRPSVALKNTRIIIGAKKNV